MNVELLCNCVNLSYVIINSVSHSKLFTLFKLIDGIVMIPFSKRWYLNFVCEDLYSKLLLLTVNSIFDPSIVSKIFINFLTFGIFKSILVFESPE